METSSEIVKYQIFGTCFEVSAHYENLKPIGMGAFGLVCAADDSVEYQKVAIKKISKPFSSQILAKRTYRELILLKNLNHENVITLKDLFLSPSNDDIYFITDLQGMDLSMVLKARPLPPQHIVYFLYQILRGLKYVHSAGVIHRDLKPSNILINQTCDLKICDFGLARLQDPQMTGYVSTRYYRAPEIMLTWQNYNSKVDIWSTGCILAEMFESEPLFPGTDHVHQFSIITELLGSPNIEVIQSISNENTLKFVSSLPFKIAIPFNKRFSNIDPLAVDLLSRMLVFDPERRINAIEALSHSYLSEFHDPDDEPMAEYPFDWSFDEQDYTTEEWKQLIVKENQEFHNI